LWKNPEKHRTVVAQVIDYAKELATWDYDQLSTAVLASSRKRGEDEKVSLEAKVAEVLSNAGVELHEFQENVAACLAEGSFLLLIVGDRISPNVALLTNAIQSAPGLGFTLGLVEMQLYEMITGNDWPLIIVPEILGRTVEKTRGVVQVRYIKEKPQIDVDVEDDGTGTTQKLDLDLFLRQIPKDLVETYKNGIEEWEQIGGIIRFTNRRVFFEMEIAGQNRKCVRCSTIKVAVMGRKSVEQWSGNPSLYDAYLDILDAAPVVYKDEPIHYRPFRLVQPGTVAEAGLAGRTDQPRNFRDHGSGREYAANTNRENEPE